MKPFVRILRALLWFVLGALFAFWLAGCELCQEHPVGCGVIGGIVVACVAESTKHRTHVTPATSTTQPVNCSVTPSMCQ